MAKPDSKLLSQWIRFLELPSAYSRFTTKLYDSMYTRGSFIAHFNREGFFKARFSSLAAFDLTISMMSKVPELKALLDNTHEDTLADARYSIACMEANILIQKAHIYLHHVAKLQAQFSIRIGGAI